MCNAGSSMEMLETILVNISSFRKRIVVFVANTIADPKFRRMREMLYRRGFYTLYLDDDAPPSEIAPALDEFAAQTLRTGAASRFENSQVKILCAPFLIIDELARDVNMYMYFVDVLHSQCCSAL